MTSPLRRWALLTSTSALCAMWSLPAQAIDIQFDYSLDTNNFFVGHPDRQNTLNAAAALFEARLTDSLTAITPGGGNTWTAIFIHPSTGSQHSVPNLTIQQNVLKVYAGGINLGGSTLGQGGPGGASANGQQAFVDNVFVRGQLRADDVPPTDFGPWGGSITFDTGTSWYFDQNILTMEAIGTMSDFYSVAVHELAHLLGFGTAESWFTWVNDLTHTFSGPASMSLNSGVPVLLHVDDAHWAEGTLSDVSFPVVQNDREAAMDPTILDGTRKYFTDLDFAGLQDVGWQVIPEPASALLLACGAGWLMVRRRR